MGTIKEELQGILTISFEVPVAFGMLPLLTPVRLTGLNDYEVEPYIGPGQPQHKPHIGYVAITNNKPNNDQRVVVAVRGRAVQRLVAGEGMIAGILVTYNTAGKVIHAGFQEAQAAFKVMDFTWDGGETITVDTTVLTEGIDFATGVDVPTTAQNIATAIRNLVPGFDAKVEDVDKVVVQRDQDGPNPDLDQTIPFIATDDDGADIQVDPALAQEGDITILDPYGITLNRAGGVDDLVDVLVF